MADDAVAATSGIHLSLAVTTRAGVAIAQGEPEQADRDAHDALATAASRTCLLEESFDEGQCGVGDVGPAVVEDQGVAAAVDLDVLGGFGVLELLLVAAVGECPGGRWCRWCPR